MVERLKSISPLFWAVVVLPTTIAAIYFGLLASDVYTSESRFVVRSPSQSAASPLKAALSQTGFGVTSEGNRTAIEYLRSRQAIKQANRDGLLTKAYSGDKAFLFDRFGGFGGLSSEQLYRYFSKRLGVQESGDTQVVSLTVKAFDPRDAQRINERLLKQSENLVNSLSQRAEADSIAIAQEEVKDATLAARNAALALGNYRDRKGVVDPEQQSKVGLQMISKLQDELIGAQTELRQLRSYTPKASQIPFLETQIRALKNEIAQARRNLAGGKSSLSSAMARYQELQLNSELAEKQLALSLASYQDAQAEARRKRGYIERIAEPSLPDYPTLPRRLRSVLATLVLSLIAWGVISMLLIGIREHRD